MPQEATKSSKCNVGYEEIYGTNFLKHATFIKVNSVKCKLASTLFSLGFVSITNEHWRQL